MTAREPQQRRKLSDVFGEVLPDTTSDERSEEVATGDAESWYRENRPPHHERD